MKKMSKTMLSTDNYKLVRIIPLLFTSILIFIFILFSYSMITTSFVVIKTDRSVDNYVIKSSVTPLRSVKEESSMIIKVNETAQKVNPFVPPTNASREDRVAWLLENLPAMEIFEPHERFHSRVIEFFDPSCEIRVFMTWISPVESFGAREFLSIESLFKAHPKGCLMILSRTMDSIQGYRILKPLIDLGFKVHSVSPDLRFLLKRTRGETWLDDLIRGNKDPGEISLAQNLSNLLRLAVLYKYGGVYMDTDFIVTKPLTGLTNSIGAQSVDPVSSKWTRLNNAVLIFDVKHPLLMEFIEEFAATFDGNKWGYNGPYLVSRVVRRVGSGLSFNVVSPMAFYPVDWNRIGGLFTRPKSREEARWVKAKLDQLRGESYGVHLWNKQSRTLAIEQGSVMANLILDHCILCKHVLTS